MGNMFRNYKFKIKNLSMLRHFYYYKKAYRYYQRFTSLTPFCNLILMTCKPPLFL